MNHYKEVKNFNLNISNWNMVEEFDQILRKTEEDLKSGTLEMIPFDEFKEEQYKKTIIRYQELFRDKESNA